MSGLFDPLQSPIRLKVFTNVRVAECRALENGGHEKRENGGLTLDTSLVRSLKSKGMKQEEIIKKAYNLFSSFERPSLFTRLDEDDDDPEANDHDNSLKNVNRRDLSIDKIGPVGYSPIPMFTPQAMGYFLPKLIEFAVNNVNDYDNDPYIVRFINSMSSGPEDYQYKMLNREQREIIYQTLLFAKQKYYEIIKFECWEDDVEIALNKWKNGF